MVEPNINLKPYFYDRLVLVMLSVNFFLMLAAILTVALRLAGNHSGAYFVQFRSHVGLSSFQTGGAINLIAFMVFVIIIMGIHTFFSLRVYKIHRQLSISILGLATVLLVVAIIIGNALLGLR